MSSHHPFFRLLTSETSSSIDPTIIDPTQNTTIALPHLDLMSAAKMIVKPTKVMIILRMINIIVGAMEIRKLATVRGAMTPSIAEIKTVKRTMSRKKAAAARGMERKTSIEIEAAEIVTRMIETENLTKEIRGVTETRVKPGNRKIETERNLRITIVIIIMDLRAIDATKIPERDNKIASPSRKGEMKREVQNAKGRTEADETILTTATNVKGVVTTIVAKTRLLPPRRDRIVSKINIPIIAIATVIASTALKTKKTIIVSTPATYRQMIPKTAAPRTIL